jgi:cyanophycinase
VPPVFLIGGGRDDDDAVRAAHAPFLQAVGGGEIVCVCEDDPDRWKGNLGGEAQVVTLGEPVDLAGAAGLYVAGGLTPAYREALAGLAVDIPYCGFSAGAAIAAGQAVVGGWRIGDRQVCDEDFSEDLEQVEPLPGLGLVPFAVEVHATQWGTVSRALHAADHFGFEVLAIDEHCCVEVRDGEVAAVHGRNLAYRIRPGTFEVLPAAPRRP